MIPKVIHYCWFGMGKKSELERAQSVIVPNNEIIQSETQENHERNTNNE